jgi:HEAT repeat protein
MVPNKEEIYSLIDEVVHGENKGMALRILAELGPAAFSTLVGAYFKEQYRAAKPQILRLLRDIDFVATEKTFISILSESSLDLRIEAVKALAALGFSPEIQQTLYATLEDPAPELRVAVLSSLARYPRADESIIIRLASHDPDPEVRRAAVYVLAQYAKRRPIPPLDKAVLDPLLLDAQSQDQDLRMRALEALAAFKDDQVFELLVRVLDTPDLRDRYRALQLLASVPHEKAVPLLIEMLGDSSYVIGWGKPFEEEKRAYIYQTAFDILKNIGLPALPYLRYTLKSTQNAQVQRLAANLIESISGQAPEQVNES